MKSEQANNNDEFQFKSPATNRDRGNKGVGGDPFIRNSERPSYNVISNQNSRHGSAYGGGEQYILSNNLLKDKLKSQQNRFDNDEANISLLSDDDSDEDNEEFFNDIPK